MARYCVQKDSAYSPPRRRSLHERGCEQPGADVKSDGNQSPSKTNVNHVQSFNADEEISPQKIADSIWNLDGDLGSEGGLDVLAR